MTETEWHPRAAILFDRDEELYLTVLKDMWVAGYEITLKRDGTIIHRPSVRLAKKSRKAAGVGILSAAEAKRARKAAKLAALQSS